MQTSHHPWQTVAHANTVTLSYNEVHVWRANLNATTTSLQQLQTLLSPDELTRAQRFHFERDHHHFIVAHGILRVLLGCYLNIPPAQLQFHSNAYGKPSLATPHDSLCFNLSHSHDLALFAFAYNKQLGVDIEFIERDMAFDELAKHTFSPSEASTITSLSGETKRQGFFNCWTRKEAYIKARGMGFSLDPSQFTVSLKPDEPAALLASQEKAQEVTRWQFVHLDITTGYAGALVAEGHDWQLRTWQWS